MELQKYGVVILDNSACELVNGGGYISFVLGYVAGTIANVVDAWSTPEGTAVSKALNDFH